MDQAGNLDGPIGLFRLTALNESMDRFLVPYRNLTDWAGYLMVSAYF